MSRSISGLSTVKQRHEQHLSNAYLIELARAAATDEDKYREGEELAEVCPSCYAKYHQLRELAKLGRKAASKPILSPREVESGLEDLMKRIQASPDPKSTE